MELEREVEHQVFGEKFVLERRSVGSISVILVFMFQSDMHKT
jgi:hypothetical protein